jgi:VIT1/CCC1 family predicted Fe2+/Mn2+ transporter
VALALQGFNRVSPPDVQVSHRPESGVGHYLRDIVNGALDGIITTLAVISGASGAQLEPRVALILGMANLVGDGISMGASNYLGLKSELLQTGASAVVEKPWRHGLATTVAFMLFGATPLAAFLVAPLQRGRMFVLAAALSVAALAILGKLRATYVGRPALRSAAEVIIIGLAASGAAYVIGDVAQRFV